MEKRKSIYCNGIDGFRGKRLNNCDGGCDGDCSSSESGIPSD